MVIPDKETHGIIGARRSVGDASRTTAAVSMHSLVNMIPGQVSAVHRGLLNVGLRLRVGERTDLRVRWLLAANITSELVPGVSVNAIIPAEAVHLESGYFRLGKRRWNRWIGRITFVETLQDRRVVSVKLHNDPVTLKCCGSMTGLNWVPQVWDTVNIVVDPTKISLDTGLKIDDAPNVSHDRETFHPFRDARVWMRAQVTAVGEAPEGRFLSLLIGTARVSVFIDREQDGFGRWNSGMTLDIHVGRYDAWLKPCSSDGAPVLCGVLYLDSHCIAVTR